MFEERKEERSYSPIDYTVEKQIAVLAQHGKYTLELNVVSFNGRLAKYDLRRWGMNADGTKYPARGISLTDADLHQLKAQLNEMEV